MTPYQRMADALLRVQGTTLPIYILDQADEQVPAEVVARKLRDRTDGAVDITGQTILNWTRQFRAADHSEPAA